jgi:type VI secretion system protein ImpH
MGRTTDPVAFQAALAQAAYDHDFYQTLRRLECLYADKPRWGIAPRPREEPVRLGQEPSLSFAPAALAAFRQGDGTSPPRLEVRLFGLLGPNGPLPLHITEYVRERLRNAGDATLARFLDIFNHRFIALLYRAWAQAQPTVSMDRPNEDRFSAYVGALFGVSTPAFRHRDTVSDHAKLFHAGLLARHVRNADGLAAILRSFFRVPAAIEQFVGHWMSLEPSERTMLGTGAGARLGRTAVLGERVWDRQHKFRIRLGPLTLQQYESFLPEQQRRAVDAPRTRPGNLRKLVDWVRLYGSFELRWDVQMVLGAAEETRLELGRFGRLGWTTWLGDRSPDVDADDLLLDAEAVAARTGGSA